MKNLWKRSASVLTAIAVAGSLMSTSAFATEAMDADSAVVEEDLDADTSGNAAVGTDAEEQTAAENDVSENTAVGAAAEEQTAVENAASANISAAADAEDRAVTENEASEETEKPAPEEPEAADGAQMKALSVQTISAGETIEVTIDTQGGYSYLYFTPEEDGLYECHSISDYDTYGYILDANENVLYYNDDSGDGNNFSIVWECTAGTTYIIKSRFWNADNTGSFSVTVDASTIDPLAPYSNGYEYYYVQSGDSVTLEASAFNYYGNEADLSGDDYTFEWHKVYDYESESGDWVNQTSEVLGTGSTYTISSVAEDDFRQDAVSRYNYYVCYICKGDETLAMTYCYIYDSDYYYNGWSKGYYRSAGESVTLELDLRDYNGDQVDVNDEAFTFEWHKVLNYLDSSTGYWIYEIGDALGADAAYTINFLSEDDLYLDAASVCNCYLCYVYKNGIRVATVYDYIYNKDYIFGNRGSSYYQTVGDSVTLGMTLYDYDGNQVDADSGDFTFEWYKVTDGQTGSAVLGTSSTYTISALTDSDFSGYSGSNYYICRVYRNGIRVATVYDYIYNKDYYISYYNAPSLYKAPGDSATLSFTLYDYDRNAVDLTSSDLTYEWYKVTNSSSSYLTSSVLGTEATYEITELETSDFYDSTTSNYNYYYCKVYRNGIQMETVYTYIYNTENYYTISTSDLYRCAGDSAELSFTVLDYDRNAVDISGSAWTFEWHKELNYTDSTTGEWVYEVGDTLGTGETLTIDKLDSTDFYNSSASVYNQYVCYIYRNGVQVTTASCLIYDKDNYYTAYGQSYYRAAGDLVALKFTLSDYRFATQNLRSGVFTYEWYKVTEYTKDDGTYYSETSDVLGTGATYVIKSVADDDFYNYNASVYTRYMCRIYKDGVQVATATCRIYDETTYFYGSTSSYYQSVGDSVTLEPLVYDHDWDEVDVAGSGFTFEWHKIYSGYDEEGNWYNNISDVLGTGSTYSIASLSSDDIYQSYNTQSNHYVCYVYKDGVQVATSYCYIFDVDTTYYGDDVTCYKQLGESVTLEAAAYNANDELADLSGSAFTFEWYHVIDTYDGDGAWTYTREQVGTGRTYTISSITDDDMFQSSDDKWSYYYCIIYKNGIQVATSYYYISDPEISYSGYTQKYYRMSGSLTLEAAAYDYTGSLADLSGSGFTFKWYKYESYYDDDRNWVSRTSDVLGTNQTYTISELNDADKYMSDDSQYNCYYCDIYKNGVAVATSYCYIYNPGDTLCVRRGNIFYVSYELEGGNADLKFDYGRATDDVLIGDWDGDGIETICVRRGHRYYISNTLGGQADYYIDYGRDTDEVIVGDWDGDGCDTLCVRRGVTFYISNTMASGNAEKVFTFGREGDSVISGDWDGDGCDTLCIRRGITYFINNKLVGGNAKIRFTFGREGDSVLAGDWDGDGEDTLCIRRGATYYINNSLVGGNAEIFFTYGRTGDQVYSGNWQ